MLQGHILLFVWLLGCEFRVAAEGKKNSEDSGCWRIDPLDQGPKVCCNRGQEILAWVMGIPLISLRKWIHVEEGKVSVGRVNRVYPSWGFTFRVISASQHHSPAQGYHCHKAPRKLNIILGNYSYSEKYVLGGPRGFYQVVCIQSTLVSLLFAIWIWWYSGVSVDYMFSGLVYLVIFWC